MRPCVQYEYLNITSVFPEVRENGPKPQGRVAVADSIWLQKTAGAPAAGATLSHFWEDCTCGSVIKGRSIIHSMPSYQDQTWIRLWKENAPELRERIVKWRKQNAIVRIEKPSRIQRARRLGYKAKQGIVVVRMRVGTGGMRKQRAHRRQETKTPWS